MRARIGAKDPVDRAQLHCALPAWTLREEDLDAVGRWARPAASIAAAAIDAARRRPPPPAPAPAPGHSGHYGVEMQTKQTQNQSHWVSQAGPGRQAGRQAAAASCLRRASARVAHRLLEAQQARRQRRGQQRQALHAAAAAASDLLFTMRSFCESGQEQG